jgi:hypothetical protein
VKHSATRLSLERRLASGQALAVNLSES